MNRSFYGERDYTFGQLMLTLRTSIGLTQAGLAERLGVSRRAVAEWEAGSGYPKAERLKQLITLGVQQQAFPAGRVAEEIRALWRAARQKVLLDEAWLQDRVGPPAPVPLFPQAETLVADAAEEPVAFPRVDWVGALDVSHFAGREVEVAELTQWIVQERCRLIALLGIGGIGKSTLASFLGQHLTPQFEAVLWLSVRDAPSCEDLVAACDTAWIILSTSVRQERIPVPLMGRGLSFSRLLSTAAMALGAVVGGLIAQAYDPRLVFGIAALTKGGEVLIARFSAIHRL